MKEPTYIQIHCDRQRARDMRWRYFPVASRNQVPPGRTYAERVDGRWQCCCCGKAVSVVW